MSYYICDYYDICHRKWQEKYNKFYSTKTGNVYKTLGFLTLRKLMKLQSMELKNCFEYEKALMYNNMRKYMNQEE